MAALYRKTRTFESRDNDLVTRLLNSMFIDRKYILNILLNYQLFRIKIGKVKYIAIS